VGLIQKRKRKRKWTEHENATLQLALPLQMRRWYKMEHVFKWLTKNGQEKKEEAK
jgi:hypothetical protein